MIKIKEYDSPCGKLLLGSYGDKLCICDWIGEKDRGMTLRRLSKYLKCETEPGISRVIENAINQLDEYFADKRRTFDLPLLLAGTDFQMNVWNALQEIPYGQTATYSEIARLIGRPTSVRAVANAIGSNPLSIVIPCHRVLGSDGSLTGYAGGLPAKRFLLSLESPDLEFLTV